MFHVNDSYPKDGYLPKIIPKQERFGLFTSPRNGTVYVRSQLAQPAGETLLQGKFPTHDQYGNELMGDRGRKAGELICGGWRAGFESWTGGWKERALAHQFVRRNYQSMQVCDRCDAVKPFSRTPDNLLHLNYGDFSLDAPWVGTIKSHEQYLNSTPEEHLTPWLAVPGFDITRVRWDIAHVILLGTGKDLAASFIYDLVPGLY